MNQQLKATLIYNPFGGLLNLKKDIHDVVAFWQKRGWKVWVKETRRPGHAESLARQAASNEHNLVLAAGGDGILGEVTNGLVNSNTILAPLPGGTGNSFAKELMMPLRTSYGRDLVRASQVLIDGFVHKIDVGRNGDGKFFLQWTGAGVDGRLVHRIEPRGRRLRRLGSLGYIAKGLLTLPAFRGAQSTVHIDGRRISGKFLMVTISNCRRYAGGLAVLNPQAVLDDGLLEAWLFEGDNVFDLIKYLWYLRLGRHINHPRINSFSGCNIVLETDTPVPVHRDGDPAGITPLKCMVQKRALRLLVPTTAPSDLMSQSGMPLPST